MNNNYFPNPAENHDGNIRCKHCYMLRYEHKTPDYECDSVALHMQAANRRGWK